MTELRPYASSQSYMKYDTGAVQILLCSCFVFPAGDSDSSFKPSDDDDGDDDNHSKNSNGTDDEWNSDDYNSSDLEREERKKKKSKKITIYTARPVPYLKLHI